MAAYRSKLACSVGCMSAWGRVSRASPVHTAVRNCTRDEGGPFEVGNQVLIPSHRKLLWSKAMVVSVAETSGQDVQAGKVERGERKRTAAGSVESGLVVMVGWDHPEG